MNALSQAITLIDYCHVLPWYTFSWSFVRSSLCAVHNLSSSWMQPHMFISFQNRTMHICCHHDIELHWTLSIICTVNLAAISSHVDSPMPSCQPAVGAFCLLPLPQPAVCSLCCSIPDCMLAKPSQHPPALQQGSPALDSNSETAWCPAKNLTITALAKSAHLLCGLCGCEQLHFLGQVLDLELFVLQLTLHISLCRCSQHVLHALAKQLAIESTNL